MSGHCHGLTRVVPLAATSRELRAAPNAPSPRHLWRLRDKRPCEALGHAPGSTGSKWPSRAGRSGGEPFGQASRRPRGKPGIGEEHAPGNTLLSLEAAVESGSRPLRSSPAREQRSRLPIWTIFGGIPLDGLLPADVQLGPAQCWWLWFSRYSPQRAEQAGVAAGRHPLLEWLNCESKSYEGSSIARVRVNVERRSWPSIEYERVSGSSGSRFGLERTFCFGTHVHTSCFGLQDLPCSRQWG